MATTGYQPFAETQIETIGSVENRHVLFWSETTLTWPDS